MLFILGAATLSSCNIQRHLPEGELLMHRAKINGAPAQFNEDMEKLVKPKPNRRFIRLFRAGMWIHIWAERRDTRFRNWVGENFGDPPVLLDTFLVTSSARQMDQLMFNRGHFDADVDFTIEERRRQRAVVVFDITPNQTYTIRDIEYYIQDRIIDSLVMTDTVNTLIQRGRRYDSRVLREERDRIAEFLRNRGYYNFTRDYVFFDVDTSLTSNQVNIGVGISGLPDFQRHQTYFIDSFVIINPDYRILGTNASSLRDTVNNNIIIGESNIHSRVLSDLIRISPGEIYKVRDVRNTIIKLSDLRIYRFIDIQFEEIPLPGAEDTMLLRPVVNLTPYKQYEGSFDVELKTTDPSAQLTPPHTHRTYGIIGSVSVRNKNLLNRAIQQEVRLRGGLEYISRDAAPNYSLGLSTTMTFPRIFIPWQMQSKVIGDISNTSIDLSWVYENNVWYERQTFRYQQYYQIKSGRWQHFIIPSELSYVQTTAFALDIDTLNPFVRNQFEPHIIPASRYAFVFSNQRASLRRSFWAIKATPVEVAGNIPYFLGRNIIATPVESEVNELGINGVEFFQYFRTQYDVRYNHILNSTTSFVYRLNMAAGVPYGNSRQLPFEKRFVIGGSNSLRGWLAGDIGPGTYLSPGRDRLQFNQIGDLLMEGNVEFRFNISNIWNGTFFLDAGNVFVWNEDLQGQTGGQLRNLDHAINSMAVAAGTGIRWDFSFFVFRLDFGWPIRTPGLDFWQIPEGFSNGVLVSTRPINFFDDGRLNFGVGYPF